MARATLLCISLLLAGWLPAMAQADGVFQVSTGVSSTFSPKIHELASGGYLVTGHSNWGNDSSYVNMIWLDENMQVTSGKDYRLQLPLNYFFSSAAFQGGYMLAGVNTGFSTYPYLIKTDVDGNMIRYEMPEAPLNYSQEKILQIIPHGNDRFSAYTSSSNVASAFYRIDGSFSDSTYAFGVISGNQGLPYLRPYHIDPLPGSLTDIICGTVNNYTMTSGLDAFLMKADEDGVLWTRYFNFGHASEETAYQAKINAEGEIYLLAQGVDTASDGYVSYLLKTDTSGKVQWGKKIFSSEKGVFLSNLLLLSGGNIVLSGIDEYYNSIFLLADPSGNLLEQKRSNFTGALSFIGDAIQSSSGQLIFGGSNYSYLVWRMDDRLQNCLLTTDTTLEVSEMMPDTGSLQFSLAPATLDFSSYRHYDRSLQKGTQVLCESNFIEAPGSQIQLYPNPANDHFFVEGLTQSPASVAVYNFYGQKCLGGAYDHQNGQDVSLLPSGIYWIRISSGHKTFSGKMVIAHK